MRIIVFIILLISICFAFDGDRKGFIIGGGVGYHLTPLSEDLVDKYQFEGITTLPTIGSAGAFEGTHLAKGLCTDFFIGAGITNKLMVYYENSVLFSKFEAERTGVDTIAGINGSTIDGVTIGINRTFLEGATSIGGRYYFEENSKTPFISASLGVAVTADRTFSSIDLQGYNGVGPALGLGFGYEFYKHLSGELQLQMGYTTDSDDTVKHRFLGIQILFTSIAY